MKPLTADRTIMRSAFLCPDALQQIFFSTPKVFPGKRRGCVGGSARGNHPIPRTKGLSSSHDYSYLPCPMNSLCVSMQLLEDSYPPKNH